MSNQNGHSKKYWFIAKRYSFGWGIPSVWQGWATIVIHLGLTVTSIYFFCTDDKVIYLILSNMGLTVAVIVICFKKGEPPRWQWGNTEDT